jgi:hypothetical protein
MTSDQLDFVGKLQQKYPTQNNPVIRGQSNGIATADQDHPANAWLSGSYD